MHVYGLNIVHVNEFKIHQKLNIKIRSTRMQTYSMHVICNGTTSMKLSGKENNFGEGGVSGGGGIEYAYTKFTQSKILLG